LQIKGNYKRGKIRMLLDQQMIENHKKNQQPGGGGGGGGGGLSTVPWGKGLVDARGFLWDGTGPKKNEIDNTTGKILGLWK